MNYYDEYDDIAEESTGMYSDDEFIAMCATYQMTDDCLALQCELALEGYCDTYDYAMEGKFGDAMKNVGGAISRGVSGALKKLKEFVEFVIKKITDAIAWVKGKFSKKKNSDPVKDPENHTPEEVKAAIVEEVKGGGGGNDDDDHGKSTGDKRWKRSESTRKWQEGQSRQALNSRLEAYKERKQAAIDEAAREEARAEEERRQREEAQRQKEETNRRAHDEGLRSFQNREAERKGREAAAISAKNYGARAQERRVQKMEMSAAELDAYFTKIEETAQRMYNSLTRVLGTASTFINHTGHLAVQLATQAVAQSQRTGMDAVQHRNDYDPIASRLYAEMDKINMKELESAANNHHGMQEFLGKENGEYVRAYARSCAKEYQKKILRERGPEVKKNLITVKDAVNDIMHGTNAQHSAIVKWTNRCNTCIRAVSKIVTINNAINSTGSSGGESESASA